MLAEGDCEDELREADSEAHAAAEAKRQGNRDRSGMSLLERIWREENRQAAMPVRSHSTTTSRQKMVPMN